MCYWPWHDAKQTNTVISDGTELWDAEQRTSLSRLVPLGQQKEPKPLLIWAQLSPKPVRSGQALPCATHLSHLYPSPTVLSDAPDGASCILANYYYYFYLFTHSVSESSGTATVVFVGRDDSLLQWWGCSFLVSSQEWCDYCLSFQKIIIISWTLKKWFSL